MRKIKLFTIWLQFIFFLGASCVTYGGDIAGVVIDSNNRPVSNAIVSIGGKSDFSDVDGQFRIKNIAEGTATITAKRYDGVEARRHIEITNVTITSGKNAAIASGNNAAIAYGKNAAIAYGKNADIVSGAVSGSIVIQLR
jgi:uncharacterized protein YjdB